MNSGFISSNDWLALTLRLSFALLVGGAIGWNRQAHNKAAGLRTYMLVSLGAALFVLVPLQIETSGSGEALSRAIQGVATGVGFLGAGEILHQSRRDSDAPKVKGLTSAAAIWVVAALGVVAGCGFWQLGTIGTLLALLVLGGVKRLENFSLIRSETDD